MKKNTIASFYLIALSAIISLSTLANFFIINNSSAAPKTLEENTKSYIYYKAWEECIGEASLRSGFYLDHMTPDDVTNGSFFSNNPSKAIRLGYLGLNRSNDCNVTGEWLTEALRLWGWGTNTEAICSFGFSRDSYNNKPYDDTKNVSNYDKCKNGSGNFKYIDINNNNLDTVTAMKRAVEIKYYGKVGAPALSPALKYNLYYQSFVNLCEAKPIATLKTANADQRTIANSDTGYVLKVLDENYNLQEMIFQANKGKGANINTTAYEYINCQEIVKRINDNSNSYATYMRSNKSTEPKPTSLSSLITSGGTQPDGGGAGTSSCAIEGVGWIICPVINFLSSIGDVAFSFLADNFLEFKSGALEIGGPLFQAWSQVLTFANVGLVIFFLIIIFSQITGFGITNYGIKKMLPRLVIVAILMNLSFFLVQIAADVSNILGYSFKNFFSGILQTSNDFQQCVDSGNVGDIGGNCSSGLGVAAAGILAGGAAVGAVAGVGGVSAALVILIPILLSAVIALLIIFLILVLRQVLLILLTVIAPIAFLAFLLPNTEGWFKKWYKTLTALLLVFPIIGIIYGLSSFASEILISTGVGSDSTLQQLIGAATLVLPLFLVPVILKKSLDSIPAIAGKVGSIGSKVTGSAKNSAKQGMEKSYIGQKAAYNKNQAAIRRAQIQSGTYAGGGIRGLGSKAFGALNRGRWSGEFGDSMLAKGAALELEERSKRDKEADALIKAIDREERKNIANTGLDSRGRRANDAVRRAALRDFASKATLEEAHELIGNVGSMSGEQRSDLVSSLQTNAVVSSAPYMDATFLSEVRSGTRLVTGSNGQTTWDWVGSISDAARRGSVNASSLASASEEAIKELNSNLDASSRAIVQQQRDTAKSDPRLSVAIAGSKATELDNI